MEEEVSSEEAVSLFLQEEKYLEKSHRLSFLGLALGLVFIGMFVYAQIRASEIAELSNQMNIQADSEGVRTLLDLVDRKIALLKSELMFRNTWVGIIGGVIVGGSIAQIFSYKGRKRKNKVMQGIVSRLGKDS